MSRNFRIGFLIVLVLAGLWLAWGLVAAAPSAPNLGAGRSAPTPTRLPVEPAVAAPNISFIDSPAAACQLARPTGCAITWSYISANAAPNYMITMTVAIDNKLRGRFNGFFQTSMYAPAEMLAFHVDCGLPGASGVPLYGAIHSYALRARDSAGLGASNFGSVICPVDKPNLRFLPMLKK
jgi:hypothetical protein